jgi:SWIM zinc finger
VNDLVLNDGRPVLASSRDDRIGRGPWARWLASAIVPDESSARAERGRTLARTGFVHTVTVAEGALSAFVIGSSGAEYAVTITAEPVPKRVWAMVARSARGKQQLEHAVAGREQSVHLEHEMMLDWDEPLLPRATMLRRGCTCPDDAGACKHVAALAYVIADAIDDDPSLLLRWRGCVDSPVAVMPAPAASLAVTGDPWELGALPRAGATRALPAGAVLKRLGRSGILHGSEDLADVLQRAYAAFADG